MGITADQIRTVGFEKARRGYNVEQVDAFLDKMAAGVEELQEQLAGAAQAETSVIPMEVPQGEDTTELEGKLEIAKNKLAEVMMANKDLKARVDELENSAAQVAPEVGADIAALEDANSRIEELERQLQECSARDKVISEAFIAAQQSADKIVAEANEEGQRIKDEAETEARAMLRDALEKKQRIFSEIDALSKSRDSFRVEYRELIEEFKKESEDKFEHLSPAAIPEGVVNELLFVEQDVVGPQKQEGQPFAPFAR